MRRSTNGLTPVEPILDVAVTHYGEAYNGNSLGCGGATYASDDGSIIAVGPERDADWPCGTLLRVCGPGGCMIGLRQDGCPGCDAYHVDVSEEGLYLVCGPGSGVCRASVEAFAPSCGLPNASPVSQEHDFDAGGSVALLAALAEVALRDRTAGLLDLHSGMPAPAGPCMVQTR